MANNNDENSTSMPAQAIIVLCLVGAGAAVLCAWAIFRHLGNDDGGRVDHGDGVDNEGYTQAQYMRLVRMRNQQDLQMQYGHYNYTRPKAMMREHVHSSVSSF